MCVVLVIVVIVFSILYIVMYGNVFIEVEGVNFIGVECYIKDEYEEFFMFYIYFGFFFFLFIIIIMVLIVLYFLVGCKIWWWVINISFDNGFIRKERFVVKVRFFSICGFDLEIFNEILLEMDDSIFVIKVKIIFYKKGNVESNLECKLEYENVVMLIFIGVK